MESMLTDRRINSVKRDGGLQNIEKFRNPIKQFKKNEKNKTRALYTRVHNGKSQ